MISIRRTALTFFALPGAALLSCAPANEPVSAREPAEEMPGVSLSIDELKKQFFHVSAGRRLKPSSWPEGARVAVNLGFDVDNASAALARGNLDYEVLSRGEYGAVDGLPRVLRMLDRQQIPASFYIPAVSGLLHPAMIDEIQASGRHEIGVHGWIHELLPAIDDENEERRLLKQSIDYLTERTGKKPVGYRAPSWKFSKHTMKLLKEEGFLYDSSLMASDDAYEILLDGEPTGILELPIERIVDDAPYFGAASGSMPSPRAVMDVFRSEFDVAHEEGGLLVLTMHPHVIGHRSRIAALEELVEYMKSRGGVWFATLEDIANYVKTNPMNASEKQTK
ncbi:MAG: polysaccharide deacetylase family protein [Vicinamibacteria bacterium]